MSKSMKFGNFFLLTLLIMNLPILSVFGRITYTWTEYTAKDSLSNLQEFKVAQIDGLNGPDIVFCDFYGVYCSSPQW